MTTAHVVLLTAYVVMIAVLGWSAWSDIKTERVPNRVTIPAIFAGIVYWGIAGLFLEAGPMACMKAALLAGGVAFICAAVFFIMGLIGGADVKTMAIVGTWSASLGCVLGTTVYGLIINTVIALIIVFKRGMVKKVAIRLYLTLMSLAAKKAPDLEHSEVKVPLVVAIFLGAALAGLEHMLGFKFPWSP
jgi:prepilin peptidase CpaA